MLASHPGTVNKDPCLETVPHLGCNEVWLILRVPGVVDRSVFAPKQWFTRTSQNLWLLAVDSVMTGSWFHITGGYLLRKKSMIFCVLLRHGLKYWKMWHWENVLMKVLNKRMVQCIVNNGSNFLLVEVFHNEPTWMFTCQAPVTSFFNGRWENNSSLAGGFVCYSNISLEN